MVSAFLLGPTGAFIVVVGQPLIHCELGIVHLDVLKVLELGWGRHHSDHHVTKRGKSHSLKIKRQPRITISECKSIFLGECF